MADPVYDSTQARYDVLRKRLQAQQSQAGSDQEEAIKRRFAQNGMLNSGAYAKSQEEGASQLEQQTAKGMEDINFQQQAELADQAKVQQAQDFQKGMFDQDLQFKKDVQAQNYGLSQQEMAENIKTNRLNATVAFKNAGISPGDFDVISKQLSEFYDMFSFGPNGQVMVGGSGQPATGSGQSPATGNDPFNAGNSSAYNTKQAEKPQAYLDAANSLIQRRLSEPAYSGDMRQRMASNPDLNKQIAAEMQANGGDLIAALRKLGI